VLLTIALDQWCPRKLLGIKWYRAPCVECENLNWATMAFLPIRPHCTNARRIRCQADLNYRPLGCPHTPWMKTAQKDLNSMNLLWMKQLTWLRIVHSGDWCLHLSLCTH